MNRLVFLCSGGGGNFRFIQRCASSGLLDVTLAGLVSDRACGAFEAAQEFGLPARRVSYRRDDNRELLGALGELAPDLIITTFDKILDAETVARYDGRLINLHYSLLPAFAGTSGPEPVRLALEEGCRVLGTTVHLVAPVVDSGPILSQSALPTRAGEGFASTLERVFRSGAVNLAGALDRFGVTAASGGQAIWSYRRDLDSLFSPPVRFEMGLFDEAFWSATK